MEWRPGTWTTTLKGRTNQLLQVKYKLRDGLTFDVGRVVDSPAGLLVVLAVFGHVIGAGRFERLVAVAGGEISRRLGRRPADDAVGHFRVDVQ